MRRSAVDRDRGFTVMEVVVAMTVFTVFATAALGVLLRLTGATQNNLRRTSATNIALRYVESARSMKALAIPVGTRTSTETVDGLDYTVTQTARFVPTDTSSSVCTGTGSTLAYKLVTIKVTWPGMGNVKPVRSDTLKAVGIGRDGLDATKGSVALAVETQAAVPLEGITVALKSGSTTLGSLVTDSDGCVIFTQLGTASTYTAVVNQPGYVGYDGTQIRQQVQAGGITVHAGKVSHATITYERARTMTIALGPATGSFPSPTAPGVVLSNSVTTISNAPCPAGTPTSACASSPLPGVTGSAKALYPALYTVQIGKCTGSTKEIDLQPVEADGSTVTVPVGSVVVTLVRSGGGVPTTPRLVTMTNLSCSGESYTLSVTGTANVVLPYGVWRFTAPSQISPTPTATLSAPATVTPTASTSPTLPTATVVVS